MRCAHCIPRAFSRLGQHRLRLHCRAITGLLAAVVLLHGIPQPARPQVDVWRVEATPALSIGGDASGPASDLFGIRGLVRLIDGRLVVGDQAQRLLLFDAQGNHVRTLGGRGGGPGEFGAILSITRIPGDTLLVADRQDGRPRLSYFTADGGFARSVTFNSVPVPTFHGVLMDGTLVLSRPYRNPGFTASGEVRIFRGEIELFRLDSEGGFLNSVGVVPGGEIIMIPIPGVPFTQDAPFLRRTLIVPGNGEIHVATGDRFEVQRFPQEGGGATRIERNSHRAIPLTESGLSEYLVSTFARTRLSDQVTQAALSRLRWNLPAGQTLPAITDLLLDEDDNLWVREGPADSDAPSDWHVYGTTGDHVASATVPARFRPYAIGSDWMLGIWLGELDVEYVQLRTLVKR